MDRFAIRLMDTLTNDRRTESGQPEVSITVQMNAFKMAQDWLVKRKKLRPDDGSAAEGEGVAALREMMNSPDKLLQMLGDNPEALDRILISRGYVKVPVRNKPGRPSKAEAAQRAQAKEAVAAHKDQQPGAGWADLGLGGTT